MTNSFQVSLFIIHSAFSRSFVCFCSFEFKYRMNRNTVSLRCYHYVCIIYNGYEFFTDQCKVLALQALDELNFPTFIAHVALETFLIKQACHQTLPNMEHQIMQQKTEVTIVRTFKVRTTARLRMLHVRTCTFWSPWEMLQTCLYNKSIVLSFDSSFYNLHI